MSHLLIELTKTLIGFGELLSNTAIINKIKENSIYIKDIALLIKRGIPNSKIEFDSGFEINAIKSTFLTNSYLMPIERLQIRYLKEKDCIEKCKEFEKELILLPRTILKIRAILSDCTSHILDRIYYLNIDTTNYYNKFILTILNSTLMTFYYDYIYGSTKIGGGYIDLKGSQIENFPIPKISKEEQVPFIELADKMISLNEDLSKKANRFLKRLSDSFEAIKINTALEKFYDLEFKDLLAQLKKQKIVLALKQQDEWEDYFNDYKTDCTNLLAQINNTDNAINSLVYQLYGLTDEEINLVEGK